MKEDEFETVIKKVNSFGCQESIFEYMPRKLLSTFPNLTKIFLSDCGLKMITRFDLHGLEALDVLHLDKNKLKVIPDDLFRGMNKLKFVDFSDNEIEYISSRVILPIRHNLQFFKLKGNKSVDVVYSDKDVKEFMRIIDESQRAYDEIEFINPLKLNGEDADYQIIAKSRDQDEIFLVHKSILEAKSPVFEALIRNNPEEIVIRDYSSEIVELMLKFLYTGKLDKSANLLINNKLIYLFAIAKKFEITSMLEFFEIKILSNMLYLDERAIYNLGNIYSSEALKWVAISKKDLKHAARTIYKRNSTFF